jgi:hypothetical protein
MSMDIEEAELILMRGELERLRSVAPDAPNRSPDHENRMLRLQAEIERLTTRGPIIAIAPGSVHEMPGRKPRHASAERKPAVSEATSRLRPMATPGAAARG